MYTEWYTRTPWTITFSTTVNSWPSLPHPPAHRILTSDTTIISVGTWKSQGLLERSQSEERGALSPVKHHELEKHIRNTHLDFQRETVLRTDSKWKNVYPRKSIKSWYNKSLLAL